MQVKCPQCGKIIEWLPSNPSRPFCSERCKMIDLGEWAAENRYIAGEPVKVDETDHQDHQD